MNLTPPKMPLVVKRLFPNYIWDIPSSEKVIYLTFDDGPTLEITDWALNTLNNYKAKATFFCVGNNVKKHPEIFQNIISNNHAIGNHTHQHVKGWKTTTGNYLKDISEASNYISSNLFRPPYGQITPKQGKEILKLGYEIVMWNVLSLDWDENVSKETCLKECY